MPANTLGQQERSPDAMEGWPDLGRIKTIYWVLIALLLDILAQME